MKTNSYFALCSLLIAILFAACGFGFDERPEERAAGFVAVEDITGVPQNGQPYVSVPLAATVLPADATNKMIEWSIKTDGGTGSTVDGARLTAGAEGTVSVTATIANGLGGGADYTQDFNIQISLTANYAVQDIYGISGALPIGDFAYTLNAQITPSNASYKNIVWSVINDGGTGTNISGNNLTAARKGTVTVRATIANGRLTEDYTQDFTIVISRGVVAAGYYGINGGASQACYWVNEEKVDLPTYNTGSSYAGGIVYVGNKQFICGYFYTGGISTLCYWVDGEYKTLPDNRSFVSIAEGGGYVYILGRDSSNNFYYWKIDANSGNLAHTAQLLSPGPYDNFNSNSLVVKNDGSAVIAVGNSYTTGVGNNYWLSNDNQNTISSVSISGVIPNDNPIRCVGLVGGKVYFAGGARSSKPFYYILEDNSYHVSTNENFLASVTSIVEQDGVPVFYGYVSSDVYSWDTGWNFKVVQKKGTPLGQTLTLRNVVYSEGDVYVTLGGYLGDDGYAVLKEPYPYRKVGAPGESYTSLSIRIDGIVVINDDMPGGETIRIGRRVL